MKGLKAREEQVNKKGSSGEELPFFRPRGEAERDCLT
jgi:hypothetical protein